MNLTPRYTLWLETLAARDRTVLTLFLLAFVAVVVVYYARRWRRWLMWTGAITFLWLLAVLVIVKPPSIPRPTFGLLMNQPLWYDETFTIAVARLPLDRMLQAVAGDVHPPLWYVVEWATIRLLGESPWAMRLPALLFALSSVWLTYRLALALGLERKTALWAAGLLAVMPAQVYYAQEARMYAMLQFFVLLAVLGVYEQRWVLLAIGLCGALYTHNLGVVFAIVVGALSMFHYPARWREKVLVGCGTVLAWSPGLRGVLRQAQAVGNGFWMTESGLGGYLLPLYRLTLGMGAVDFIEQHALVAAAGMGALALWAAWRGEYPGRFLLALVGGPSLMLVLASEVWRPIYLERVFLVSLPFLVILVVVALRWLKAAYRDAILVALVPLVGLCLLFQSKGTETYRAFADDFMAEHRPGDVIYHVNLATYIQLSYYLPDAEHVCWPNAGNLEQSLSVETQEAMGIRRASAAEVWDGEHRLFVVWSLNPLSAASEEQALSGALALGEARQLIVWEESELVTAGVWEVAR
jgi:hypothetical protein